VGVASNFSDRSLGREESKVAVDNSFKASSPVVFRHGGCVEQRQLPRPRDSEALLTEDCGIVESGLFN
jgi:hypothetical protein